MRKPQNRMAQRAIADCQKRFEIQSRVQFRRDREILWLSESVIDNETLAFRRNLVVVTDVWLFVFRKITQLFRDNLTYCTETGVRKKTAVGIVEWGQIVLADVYLKQPPSNRMFTEGRELRVSASTSRARIGQGEGTLSPVIREMIKFDYRC